MGSTSAGVKGEGSVGVSGDGSNMGVQAIGDTYGVHSRGAIYDFYAAGAGANYSPFTGSHEVRLSASVPKDLKVGMIFSATGETSQRKDEDGNVSISSTLPTVKLSDSENDKTIFGVFTSEQELSEDHWYVDYVKDDDRFALVNALGEGRLLVTDVNGEIEVGDFVTSSNIPGYAMRQNDDLLHSYTIGKVTEKVDWNNVGETIKYNGKNYKVYLIGVTYTSG